jgi:hypothetical protein
MNFIHSEKTVWILPERTATRTVGQLLNFWEVQIFEGNQYKTCVPNKNINGEFSQGLRHEWNIPQTFFHYDLILNVRNPYTRMKSYYYSLFLKNDCSGSGDCHISFLEFLQKYVPDYGGMSYHFGFEKVFTEIKPPKYVVKYENLAEDLMKIPFINKKHNESEEFRSEWDRVVTNNIFNKETKGNSYNYSEQEAELIYNSFQKQFELFGYEENSWRYL